jgi:NTE family protein
MSCIPDDKSAPEECYKNEAEHGLAADDGHINLSDPNAEPELYLGASPSSVKQSNKKHRAHSPHKTLHTHSPHSGHSGHRTLRIPPRRLAFCGGGVRCVGHVGVLKALAQANILGCVKEVVGISAGALFGLMIVLGYTVAQMEELAIGFDFTLLGEMNPECIFEFPVTLGINSGESIYKLLGSILKQKGFSPDITFAELVKDKRIHKTYKCYAAELQTSIVKEMSYEKTPDMSVVKAIRASMSLPILYTPVKEGDSLLVDGGLLHNLPLAFLNEEEISETWAVIFSPDVNISANPLIGIFDYLKYVMTGLMYMRNVPYIEKYHERIIVIKNNFDVLGFSVSSEARAKFIEDCRKITHTFLHSSNKPARRFSAA